MPHLYKSITILPIIGGDADNQSQMQLYFIDRDDNWSTSTAATIIAAKVQDFWTSDHGGGGDGHVDYYLSQAVNRFDARVEIYDAEPLRDPNPEAWQLGPAIATTALTLPNEPDGGPLPDQVAAKLSWRAGLNYGTLVEESDPDGPGGIPAVRPRSRRRGGIFIGPLATTTLFGVGAAPSQYCEVNADFISTAVFAARGLALNATSDVYWAHWSQADQQEYRPYGAWVDSRHDVQRRRGSKRTTKALFDLQTGAEF